MILTSSEKDIESSEKVQPISSKSKRCKQMRSEVRLAIISSGLAVLGCMPIHKNIRDIQPEEEPGITSYTEKSVRGIPFEMKRILAQRELLDFEAFNNAHDLKTEINYGLYFLQRHPTSLVASIVKQRLEKVEQQLSEQTRDFFSRAKENPDQFLKDCVVKSGQDQFLNSATLLLTRFPKNPNNKEIREWIADYLQTMGYVYVKIDASDKRLANQKIIKPGEFAFAKFYKKSEYWQDNIGNIWTPATQTVVYRWVVVSLNGDRVGLSEIRQTSTQPSMLLQAIISAGTAVAAVAALGALTSSGTAVLSEPQSSQSETKSILEEKQSSPPVEDKHKKLKKCEHSCERNWVDTCGRGLHTLLPLPGENYTPLECKQHYNTCLNNCAAQHK